MTFELAQTGFLLVSLIVATAWSDRRTRAAFRELRAEFAELRADVSTLQPRLDEIDDRLAALEASKNGADGLDHRRDRASHAAARQ